MRIEPVRPVPGVLILKDGPSSREAVKLYDTLRRKKAGDVTMLQLSVSPEDGGRMDYIDARSLIDQEMPAGGTIIAFNSAANIAMRYILDGRDDRTGRLVIINRPESATPHSYMDEFLKNLARDWTDYIIEHRKTAVPVTSIRLNDTGKDPLVPVFHYIDSARLPGLIEDKIKKSPPLPNKSQYYRSMINLSDRLTDEGWPMASRKISAISLNEIDMEEYPYLFADAANSLGLAILSFPHSMEDLNEAVRLIDRSLAIWQDAGYTGISLKAAQKSIEINFTGQAVKWLENAASKTKDRHKSGMLHAALGKAYLPDKKKAAEALSSALKNLDKTTPIFFESKKMLGEVLAETPGKRDEAAAHLQDALAFYKLQEYPETFGEISFWLGQLKGAANDIVSKTEAVNHLQNAITYLPAGTRLRYGAEQILADVYLQLGQKLHSSRYLASAAKHYQSCLNYFTESAYPAIHKKITLNLASAYARNLAGNREANMQKALVLLQNLDSPEASAETGIAHFNLSMGRQGHMQKAAVYFKKALQSLDRNKKPELYAELKNYLGATYLESDINLASREFTEAQQIVSDRDSYLYNIIQVNISAAYINIQAKDRSEIIRNAVSSLEKTAEILSARKYPYDYAVIQLTIASAYASIGKDKSIFGKASTACKNSLMIFQKDEYPYEYAKTKMECSPLYVKWGGRELIQEAVSGLDEASAFFTREKYPEEYARIKHNLGDAYMKAGKLKKAVEAYRETASIWTPKKEPVKYAYIQNSIGTAYMEMKAGNGENIKQAKGAFKNALKYISKEKSPLFYSIIQSNLKNAEQQKIN